MNYSRPVFFDLHNRIRVDLAVIPDALALPLSAMWARACHSLHGYLDWILAQCSPLTCELERLYDWSALYATNRLLAVAAQGSVLATGNAGAVVLADTLLRSSHGFDYVVMNAVTLTATDTPVSVRCTTRGAITNVAANQVLTLIDPVLGCNNNMRVSSHGLTGGADDESVDAWRLRVAEEWQTMVKYGGRAGKVRDYIAWAKAAHPSVTGALVDPHALGIGTVLIRPICNDLDNRLPTQSILNAIATYLSPLVPATADWRLATPLLHPVTVSIQLSPDVNTAENQLKITNVLSALVRSKISNQDTILITDIDIAILSVTSEYVRNLPMSSITAAAGEVFILSPVVFTTS